MKISIWSIMLMLLAVSGMAIMSCGKSGVEPNSEPTDYDAIWHIIQSDRPNEFNIDLMDFSVPDTSMLLSEPYKPLYFWRSLDRDSLFPEIVTFPPVDSTGAVPYAEVTVKRYFWGTLEIIALDTTGGGSQRVRLSKPFTVFADMDAKFEKVGFDYNTRRGWILTGISDIRYGSYTRYLNDIAFYPASSPQTIFHAPMGLTALANVREFSPGESLTVAVRTDFPSNYVFFRYPTSNGFVSHRMDPESLGVYTFGFRLPAGSEFNHFLIDVVNSDAVVNNIASRYEPAAIGVLYRAR